jgi:ribosomal protein S6--L-glutamate ligase
MQRGLTAIEAEQRVSAALAEREPSIVVLGKPTETNCALVGGFEQLGYRAQLAHTPPESGLAPGSVVIGRIDVLPTLDGIEPALVQLAELERQGAHVLNRASSLVAAHDKLMTALFLGRAKVAQPRTAHVRDVSVPSFGPPYVVKPRFGSWGHEVHLSHDEDDLRALLARLASHSWFQRQGALVQSLVQPTGRDLRVVVAAGRVVGAIERRAQPGEWRTNVALGAERLPVRPSLAARALALRAVAALGIDLAGVDIAGEGTGAMHVLEVNGAVDFNEVYGPNVFASAATALMRRAAAQVAVPVGSGAGVVRVDEIRDNGYEADCLDAVG